MERRHPLSIKRTLEFVSRDALVGVIPLSPAEAAREDEGYSLHGIGADTITCAVGAPGGVLHEVTRLSPTAIWVMPQGPLAITDPGPVPVYLLGRGGILGPITGVFLPRPDETSSAPVGLELVGVTLAQGREILALLAGCLERGVAEPPASLLPVEDTMDQPERIRAILLAVCVAGHKGVLRRMGRTIPVVLERLDHATSQLEWRMDEPVSTLGEAPCDLEVTGYNSTYRMKLVAGRRDGDRLFTPLPDRMFRVRHRSHRRAPAPVGVRVRFHHPLWRELGELACDVVDLSFRGMSIRCRPEDLMFPGLQLPSCELHTTDHRVIGLSGVVRHVSRVRADGTVLCGLSVRPGSSDEADWIRLVSQAASPHTRTSANLEDAVWELFLRSGYFDLAGRPAEEFEQRRPAFCDMANRAAEVPQLFCQAVWPSERGVEATLSILKPYRHAWVAHQVAKRPGKPPSNVSVPGQIMRDLYVRVFEHPQSDPDFRWVVSYVEALNPWVEKAHVRYAERQMATGAGLAFTRKVHMLEVLSHELTGLSHEGIAIGSATPDELRLLSDTIACSRPDCYRDALDLTPERLDLRAVVARWREQDLEREREVVVARRGGVPVAAAVLELCQQGTNLYSMLDMARLFPLTDAGPRAYVALVDAARGWYAARGRASFRYLCEDEGGAYLQEANIHGGPDPYLWILSAKLIPDFLEHISELTIGRRTALTTTRQGDRT